MKKRLLSMLMAMCLMATMVPAAFAAVSDEEFMVDNFRYVITDPNEKKVSFAKPTGASYTGEITVPETVQHNSVTYTVTAVQSDAFLNSNGVTKVVLPNSVTSIPGNTFAGCSSLTSISFGNAVTSIGSGAFAGCSSLSTLEIPETVTSIGGGAFANLGAASLQIPASVTTGDAGLIGYDHLDKVTFADGSPFKLAEGVLYCGDELVVALDRSITTCNVLEGTKSIGAKAFSTGFVNGVQLDEACKSLTSVTLPSSLETIGDEAFGRSSTNVGKCTALSSVTFSDVETSKLTKIGNAAFGGCTELSSFDLPDSLTSIGEQAFQSTKLTSVVIPEGVTSIPKGTFSKVSSLKTVVLLGDVDSIGMNAFSGWKSGASDCVLVVANGTAPDFDSKAFGVSSGSGCSPTGLSVLIPMGTKDAFTTDTYILKDFVGENSEFGLIASDAILKVASSEEDTNNTTTLTAGVPNGCSLMVGSANEDIATVAVGEDGQSITITSVAAGDTTIAVTIKLNNPDCTLAEKTLAVTVLAADKEPAVVVPADTEAKADLPAGATDEEQEIAGNVADALKPSTSEGGEENPGLTVDNEVLSNAAHSVMVNNTVSADEGKTALTNGGVTVNDGYTVSIVVQPYLDVTVTDVKQTGEQQKSTTLTLDITPMYRKVATTAPVTTDPNAEIVLKAESGGTQNAVVLPNQGGELTITTSTKVSVPLPENLLTGDTAYIVHTKDNGRSYVYTGTIENNILTFTSKHGFSTFTISMEDPTAAKIGDTSYPTLQDALDEASNNEEIVLVKGGLSGNLTTTKTVTLKNGTEGEITVTVNGTAYTIVKGGTQEVSYTKPTGGGGGGGSSSSGDYIVSVDKTTHGKVTVSPSRADKGDTVTITVKPDKGYELDELTVTDKNGDEIKLTEKADNKFTFKMPGSKVTVEASFKLIETEPEASVFADVPADAYYADAVAWAVKEGITSGTSSTTFSPNASCTRAQMVTFLWRANGSPKATGVNPFTDVSTDAYYYDAVLWAAAKGITAGTSATTFSPDATLTRGQTVTFLWRANGSPVVDYAMNFADVDASTYYGEAVRWAVSEGITAGTGGNNFSPDAPCTRAQIVTFMYRAQ